MSAQNWQTLLNLMPHGDHFKLNQAGYIVPKQQRYDGGERSTQPPAFSFSEPHYPALHESLSVPSRGRGGRGRGGPAAYVPRDVQPHRDAANAHPPLAHDDPDAHSRMDTQTSTQYGGATETLR